MAWSDAARAAALDARRNHSVKVGTNTSVSRGSMAKALHTARKMTKGMSHRNVVTRRYASQILRRK